jgi:hypothetical protein
MLLSISFSALLSVDFAQNFQVINFYHFERRFPVTLLSISFSPLLSRFFALLLSNGL